MVKSVTIVMDDKRFFNMKRHKLNQVGKLSWEDYFYMLYQYYKDNEGVK